MNPIDFQSIHLTSYMNAYSIVSIFLVIPLQFSLINLSLPNFNIARVFFGLIFISDELSDSTANLL